MPPPDEIAKRDWPTSYVNDLSDTAFLFIENGGEKDSEGMTKPRDLRHFPVYDADGQLDLPHLRNAISRIPQASSDWLSQADKDRLQEKARKLLADAQTTTHKRAAGLPSWALDYVAHADASEAIGLSGDLIGKAWQGDPMIGKRSAELLRGRVFKAADRVSKRVTKAIDKVLRAKVAAHNAGSDVPKFRVRVGTVKAAYSRGVAAYQKTKRPCVKSGPQWGFARVKALLSYCKTGSLPHPSYTDDLDIFPRAGVRKDDGAVGDLAAGGALAPQKLQQRTFAGLPIVIDRPKGFVQRKMDDGGKLLWERTYKVDYGYVPSTLGGDSEELDVFLGPDEHAPSAFWVVQTDEQGDFDEYKVVLGTNSEEEARAIYTDHVPEKFLGRMFETPVGVLQSLLGLEPGDLLKAVEPSYHFVASKAGEVLTAHPWTTLTLSGTGPNVEDEESPAAPPKAPLTMSAAEHAEMAAAMAAVKSILPSPTTKIATPLVPGGRAAEAGDVSLFSSPDPIVADVEAILAAAEAAPAALLELPDSLRSIATLGRLGGVFKLDGAPGRVWVATYPVPRSKAVRPIDEEEMAWAEGEEEQEKAAPEGSVAPSAADAEVEKASVGKAGTLLEIGKADASEERYTLGIVLVPDEPDLQGDVYSKATVRQAAYVFMSDYQNTGLQHNVKPGEIEEFRAEHPDLYNGKILIVDSFVIPDEMGDVMINGRLVKAGTWLMGHRWVDDALWADVKSCKYTGLSMGGFARRIALTGSPAAADYAAGPAAAA